MQLFRISFESHTNAATIYITGLLGDVAATRVEELIRALPPDVLAVRVDMRAVELIDPGSFVRVARVLTRWRDARGGRVGLEFPERSRRRRGSHLRLVDQNRMGSPVSTAINWPMSTSPG